MKRNWSEAERRRARALLRHLAANLDDAADGTWELPPAWRPFAKAWANLDNIAGVHVYEASLGGWQFAIELKTVPTGCPLVLGSPSTVPYRQREEAVTAAQQMLGSLAGARTDRQAMPSAETDLWFRLHDCDIALPRLLFEFARTEQLLKPMAGEDAWTWLELRLAKLDLATAPGPHSTVHETIDDLSPEDRCGLLATLCRAHAAGIFQFPAVECLSPSGHMLHLTPQ